VRASFLLLLLVAAPALADKKTCVESGEKLYVAQPAMEDIQQTFRHCRPLAEAGDGEAQYYFASVHMFRTISQPPANPVVEKWMKLSAENGYGKAQFYMATVYRYGNALTPPDIPKMMEMYEKAARQGVPPAAMELERIWRYGGYGFPPDEKKAQYWKEQLERQRCCK
jgi:TPR repeat protein